MQTESLRISYTEREFRMKTKEDFIEVSQDHEKMIHQIFSIDEIKTVMLHFLCEISQVKNGLTDIIVNDLKKNEKMMVNIIMKLYLALTIKDQSEFDQISQSLKVKLNIESALPKKHLDCMFH